MVIVSGSSESVAVAVPRDTAVKAPVASAVTLGGAVIVGGVVSGHEILLTGLPLIVPELLIVPPHLLLMIPLLMMVPELEIVPPELLVISPELLMVPVLVMVPELVMALSTLLVIVPSFSSVTPESIVTESPLLRVRLASRVQVLVPELQVPPIASHAPLASPTCNS